MGAPYIYDISSLRVNIRLFVTKITNPKRSSWPAVHSCNCDRKLIIHLQMNISKVNQQDATFFRSIYFYKLLYMFQAVSSPIIRSTKLYIQRQVLSNPYCCLLLWWMRWNSMEFHLIHDSSRQQYWFDNT